MDQPITQWINSFAGGNVLLDSIMVMATKVGVPFLVALVVAQWWSEIDKIHVRHTCIAAGLSFLIGLGLNQIILLFVHRVRPYDAGVSHLIISKSGLVVSVRSRHGVDRHCHGVCPSWLAPSHASFRISGIADLLVAHFVGTHYLTDVLGGGLMGLVAATLVWVFYREESRLDRFATGIL